MVTSLTAGQKVVAEVASAFLGCSARTLLNLRRRGELTAFRDVACRRVVYRAEDLIAFKERQLQPVK